MFASNGGKKSFFPELGGAPPPFYFPPFFPAVALRDVHSASWYCYVKDFRSKGTLRFLVGKSVSLEIIAAS